MARCSDVKHRQASNSEFHVRAAVSETRRYEKTLVCAASDYKPKLKHVFCVSKKRKMFRYIYIIKVLNPGKLCSNKSRKHNRHPTKLRTTNCEKIAYK
jgi:hypothetical protein